MAYIKKEVRLKAQKDFLKKHKDFDDFLNKDTSYYFNARYREEKRDFLRKRIKRNLEELPGSGIYYNNEITKKISLEEWMLEQFRPEIKEIESFSLSNQGFVFLILIGLPLYGYLFMKALNWITIGEGSDLLLPLTIFSAPFIFWYIYKNKQYLNW